MQSNFPKSVRDGVILAAIERAILTKGKAVIPYDDLLIYIEVKSGSEGER